MTMKRKTLFDKKLGCIILLLYTLFPVALAWDEVELEIFDAVEDVGNNFYEILGISQEAELSEVKKAYRNLSKQLHPDKNDAPDADVQFRQLVSVYDVLRDEKKRAIYNRVLLEGLPDWRSPIFYYRRARKMAMFEIVVILTVVISLTQYLTAWVSYFDKKATTEEMLYKKKKVAKEKRKKKNEDLDVLLEIQEELDMIPRPSLWNILPIQIWKLSIFLVTGGPEFVKQHYQMIKQEKENERIRVETEEQLIRENEERRKEKKAQRKERKKVDYMPDRTGEKDPVNHQSTNGINSNENVTTNGPCMAGTPWTYDDFTELARLMTRYPPGTYHRWDVIAEQLERTVQEVAKMGNKGKHEIALHNELLEPEVVQVKEKSKVNKIDLSLGEDSWWLPSQQKALEKSLKLYRKGEEQRWEKIAEMVPDKTKDECMIRFKYLAEKIRKRKEENIEESSLP